MVPAGGTWLCRDQGTWLWDRAGHSMQVTASATRQCEPQLLQPDWCGDLPWPEVTYLCKNADLTVGLKLVHTYLKRVCS